MSIVHTIFDQADIKRAITRMTHEIIETHKNVENLAIVGIQTRGVYLARRIQEMIASIEGIKPPTGCIDITLYRDDWTRITPHPVVGKTDIDFSVDSMHILLVDDVLFTGRTIRAAMNALIDFGRPDRVEVAVLLDRGHRELPIYANYIGKTVRTRREESVDVMLLEHDGIDKVDIRKEELDERQHGRT